MNVSIPYGRTHLEADIPDRRLLGVFESSLPPPAPDAEAEVARALDAPFGSPTLEELAHVARNAVLILSDHTRPVPSRVIVPPMLARLRRGNLYTLARKLNFNKIALGQHLDDAEVSFLMSLCRGAGLTTMGPNVSEKNGGIRIIRPLILTPENMIAEWIRTLVLPVRGECRYKEQLENGDRRFFRNLLDQLSERIPDLRSNMLRSLSNIQEEYLFDPRFLPGGKS